VSVYVDEAQEYFDDNIETILNQARKYRVGLTLAHQTLDQLSPRLRSALFANTSFKCAGGVSAKDARALSDELHTTPDFIEGMKRRGARSEFAAWVKHRTGQAIRLSVELGYLERQPALTEEAYDDLLAANRERFCGTLAQITYFRRAKAPEAERSAAPSAPPVEPKREEPPPPPVVQAEPHAPNPPAVERPSTRPEPPMARDLGKGGAKHRYLQSLVKELAEAGGLKATIEAPLPGGGQADVLIERDGIVAAVEISVSTPVEHERENLRKCLAANAPRVAVVLAKSRVSQSNYRAALSEVIPDADRERVVFLTPEELPEFIENLAPPPASTERIVRGYRVKGSLSSTSPEDARAKRDALARLIAKSLTRQRE
jgi:hypothetical protein